MARPLSGRPLGRDGAQKSSAISTPDAGIAVTRRHPGAKRTGRNNGNAGHANAARTTCGAIISVGNLAVGPRFVDSPVRIAGEGRVDVRRVPEAGIAVTRIRTRENAGEKDQRSQVDGREERSRQISRLDADPTFGGGNCGHANPGPCRFHPVGSGTWLGMPVTRAVAGQPTARSGGRISFPAASRLYGRRGRGSTGIAVTRNAADGGMRCACNGLNFAGCRRSAWEYRSREGKWGPIGIPRPPRASSGMAVTRTACDRLPAHAMQDGPGKTSEREARSRDRRGRTGMPFARPGNCGHASRACEARTRVPGRETVASADEV